MISPTERGTVRRQALSISVATALYGISFGALAIASGLDRWQTMALSLLMFTGASQFALIGVVGAGGGPIPAVAGAALLGLRNTLYGIQLAGLLGLRPKSPDLKSPDPTSPDPKPPDLKSPDPEPPDPTSSDPTSSDLEPPNPIPPQPKSGWRIVAAAQVTIDESTATALAQPTPTAQRMGFWWAGIGVFVGWNAMTLLGAIVGDVIGDPRAWGLDAAAAAAFLALLWPRLTGRAARATAALAACLASGLIPLVPPGLPVLVGAVAAVVVGLAGPRDRPSPQEQPC